MPRQARLDAPGTLHHVILRGLARGRIVVDEEDRAVFVARLGAVATATGTRIYAWALLPNHAHLLLRSGPTGLPRFMRRVLTGYALEYNRRHRRAGHVFQNRYKSIVVEAEPYLLELVRYIHLNPLRGRLVPDLQTLARYRWCGHAGLLGHGTPPWLDRAAVLAWFGRPGRSADRAYQVFVADGVAQGHRPDLVGGGLIRSLGGWAAVRAVRRRGTRVLADERILGTDTFVARMLAAGDTRQRAQRTLGQRLREAQGLLRRRCRQARVSLVEFQAGSRRRHVATLRAELAVYLVTQLGLSLAETARQLGISTSGVAKAVMRAERQSIH